MDEKTEKINVIADEDVAVAEESGPVEERRPRRRAACAGGAAALAAVAVAVAVMMQPAEAVEVEGFAARALIPHIPIESPWAAGGAAVPGDEALADTGEAEASEGTAEEPGPADGAPAAEAGQQEQGAASPAASGSSAAAPAQGSASSGSASQPQQQAPAASQPQTPPATQQPSSSSNPVVEKEPQAPKHEHDWIPITETKNTTYILCACGKTFSNGSEHSAHEQAAGRGESHGYKVMQKNETVTTGYKCSCGATK